MPSHRNSRRSSSYSVSSHYSQRASCCRVHQADVDESDATPSAPCLELMDPVEGYESLSFDAVNIPPPFVNTLPQHVKENSKIDGPTLLPVLTEQQARSALLDDIGHHCCYGKDAAIQMAITKLEYSSAIHYKLYTFSEKRESAWAFKPYKGEEVDGRENGTPPLPWDIVESPHSLYFDEVRTIVVPHTTSIKPCHRCNGKGTLLCAKCHGKGWVHCHACHPPWQRHLSNDTVTNLDKERCYNCSASTHGRGRQDCDKCHLKGKVPCPPCAGHGNLKCFVQVTITWKTTMTEHIMEKMNLPKDFIKSVTGIVVFEYEAPMVTAINNFPEETINLASAQILSEHARELQEQKIMSQKQVISMVPVTEITYQWRRKKGTFFVYGNEKRVHAPEYPQKYCCSIV